MRRPALQTIRALERDKERFASEAAGVNAKYKAAAEEVALRDAAILDLQRRIAGAGTVAERLGWWWQGRLRAELSVHPLGVGSCLAALAAAAWGGCSTRCLPAGPPARLSRCPPPPSGCGAEGEARLRQQQELYEAVRSERNNASRSLVEVQDEISELRRRLAVVNHQARACFRSVCMLSWIRREPGGGAGMRLASCGAVWRWSTTRRVGRYPVAAWL